MTTIENIAVIGLGRMGHGIAQTFALAGYDVTGFDADAEALASTSARVLRNLEDFTQAGICTAEDATAALSRIHVVESEEACVQGAHFVVEAIAEDLEIKQQLFSRIEPLVDEDTILASNSSSFPISQSNIHIKRRGRALVTHWFNPPHIVPAVEIVPGPETDPTVADAAMELHRAIGKLPVCIRKEVPGFIINRLQVALIREVWDLLEKGVATPEDIDTAVRGSLGFRLALFGPLKVCDFGGLDIWHTMYGKLAPDICSTDAPPPGVSRMVKDSEFGLLAGKGFYDYSATSTEAVASERDALMIRLAKLLAEDA